MILQSRLFRNDRALQACLVHDSAHIQQGSAGDHVKKIQMALALLDNLEIDAKELVGRKYGSSTASAVLAFKTRRNIINRSYQTQADNIVGKMTISVLDTEMLDLERTADVRVERIHCDVTEGDNPLSSR